MSFNAGEKDQQPTTDQRRKPLALSLFENLGSPAGEDDGEDHQRRVSLANAKDQLTRGRRSPLTVRGERVSFTPRTPEGRPQAPELEQPRTSTHQNVEDALKGLDK